MRRHLGRLGVRTIAGYQEWCRAQNVGLVNN
jgi:hypothetical protein